MDRIPKAGGSADRLVHPTQEGNPIMVRRLAISCIALAALLATPAMVSAKAPDTWDNLIKVKSKRIKAVYLLPNTDFRVYTKVMLDPTEVAFTKNWQRNVNNSSMRLGRRVSDSDVAAITSLARSSFQSIFANAFGDAGYQVVAAPGPDVMRVITGVLDLYIAAPDPNNASMGHVVTAEAGEATLVVEVRDSLSNAVLGRAVDKQVAGDMAGTRSRASNRNDFEDLFKTWAKASIRGLNELKAVSPINAEGRPRTP
jgi:Protein of unknown function (DUF3313)